MILEERCIEYYFDSKYHNKQEILENMETEIKKFEKKKAEVQISLNDYGIYVVKLIFTKKKKERTGFIFFNNNKQEKERVFGSYKPTKNYMPI